MATLLLASITPCLAPAQSIITTVAGSRYSFTDGLTALNTPVGAVNAVVTDRAGLVYFADLTSDRVYRIDSRGIASVFAGNGVSGYAGDDGLATSASLSNPRSLALDGAGNLYIADSGNSRIRKVTAAGVISTVAGNGVQGFSGDGGTATKASLGGQVRIALDARGDLYISDPDNNRVRRVSGDGTIRTVVGTGAVGSTGDGGPATSATLQQPAGLAFDATGSLYIADISGRRIRRVTPEGTISSFGGNGLVGPAGLAFDSKGSLFIADQTTSLIHRVDPSGTVSTIAGTVQVGLAGDGGVATSASLYAPVDLSFTATGALLIADSGNFRVRQIASGTITTIAGNGNYHYTGDGGPATVATLPGPASVAVDPTGNVHICDSFANRVRTVDIYGTLKLTAGTSTPGFSGDGGSALNATLTDCRSIAADTRGNLYVADTGNHRIRKITPGGIISTVAGNGAGSFSGDGGLATSAALNGVSGVAVDGPGNLYIADTGNNRIRKVSTAGIISTVAGNGSPGYRGDGGSALLAAANAPTQVAADAAGNFWFSDSGNNVVRRVTSAGIISTVAGNGKSGFSGDGGPAASAALANPLGLALDSAGVLYIADTGNRRIRRVDSSGVISTVAGDGSLSASGDGRNPLLAGLGFPAAVTFDGSGNLYIADRLNARIRRIQPAPAFIALSQTGFTFNAAVDAAGITARTLTILNRGPGAMPWAVSARTTSGGNWLRLSPTQGTSTSTTTSSVVAVSVDAAGLVAGIYYGQIQVSSPGVANSPRFATVVLRVLSTAQNTGPTISPSAFLFNGTTAQTLTIAQLRGSAVSFTATATVPEGPTWLTVKPVSGSVAPGSPLAVTLQPVITGLAAGVYTATVNLTFSDGSKRAVPATLTLAAAASSTATISLRGLTTAASCVPSKLIPVGTTFGAGFSLPAGWPIEIEVVVKDNCGNSVLGGTVAATFSNGDPPVALTLLHTGIWSATWAPRRASPGVTITLLAQNTPAPNLPVLKGSVSIAGSLTANVETPVIDSGGILNAASYAEGTAAPGAYMVIFGANLATQSNTVSTLPLPNQLGGVTALIGGRVMPLLYAGPTQINAMVPFDVPSNGAAQVVVQVGLALAVPEDITVAPAAPGAFTLDSTGTGPAIAVDIRPDGSGYLTGPTAPAHPGDALVIYCGGIGGVQSSIEAGQATPLSPLTPVTDAVSVTIGGVSAQVDYAGLVATLSGLYQVNIRIPSGISGDALPLVITVAGQISRASTIAVR